MNYQWPGNVRELEHAIEHAFIIAVLKTDMLSDIPLEINHNQGHPVSAYESPTISDKGSSGKINAKTMV